ncbi:WXG100 family type VII secretion target [Mycobacterium sp. 360MFTsu5.1]|uniref:WXG100 family type VII secretion target n=1 Tax=Mycobacterium sp. 360MFTsu5.1 TaxID=1172186 RepID=UPI000362672B|nr:WXG100 family type VII secretion target [Mycobacterium sp. 360MFTsu5.1]
MSGELRVNPADLTLTAQAADTTADEMFERYHAMAAEVVGLLDGRWKGAAADACRSAWDEWSDGFRLVLMGLRDEADVLRAGANEYTAADSRGAAGVSSAGQAI